MIHTARTTTRKDGRKQVTCYDTTHRPYPHRHSDECDQQDAEREQNEREWRESEKAIYSYWCNTRGV